MGVFQARKVGIDGRFLIIIVESQLLPPNWHVRISTSYTLAILRVSYQRIAGICSHQPSGRSRSNYEPSCVANFVHKKSAPSIESTENECSVLKMRYPIAIVGQTLSSLTYLLTIVNALTLISPPQTSSHTLLPPSLVNTTVLDLTIDPRFGFKAEYGETNLPVTPCLMNVVELLARYAMLDWMSKVGSRAGIVLPEFPEVEIAVIPAAPAASVEVHLIIWGIWAGIRDIIQTKNFHEAEFEVYWESKVVAYIYFAKPLDLSVTSSNETQGTGETLTLLPSLNDTTGGTLDNFNSTDESSHALNKEPFSWDPFFIPDGKTLTIFEVFLTVMAGLKSTALHAASEKVPGPYAAAAVDVDANVQFFLHQRRSPRPKPPYFRYIHIIEALRLVPGYMLDKRKFRELLFTIEIDGIKVGEGYLEKGRYVPPRFIPGDMLWPKDNVSLS